MTSFNKKDEDTGYNKRSEDMGQGDGGQKIQMKEIIQKEDETWKKLEELVNVGQNEKIHI